MTVGFEMKKKLQYFENLIATSQQPEEQQQRW